MTTTVEHRADLEPVHQHHHFGDLTMPGEPTEHAALRITPDVTTALNPAATGPLQRVRYTGFFSPIHIPTGSQVPTRNWLPLEWLRRFARLLAGCGIEWHTVEGPLWRIDHPQWTLIRSIGDHVLDCWRRGVPVGPGIGTSLHLYIDGCASLHCGNRQCESDMASSRPPAMLAGLGEDGQDEAVLSDRDLLYELARDQGWSRVGEHGMWLCETCTETHQPAPDHIARRLTRH